MRAEKQSKIDLLLFLFNISYLYYGIDIVYKHIKQKSNPNQSIFRSKPDPVLI